MKNPTTYKSRVDVNIEQTPFPAPNVSLGQNALVVDPKFNNRIVRVTDASLSPQHPGFSYFAGLGGSADVNAFNAQSTKFCFEDQGNRQFVMQFSPLKMKVSPLYPTHYSAGTFCVTGGAIEFAKYGDILFQFAGSQVLEYDFGQSPLAPPTPKVVCDFTKAISGFKPTWQSAGGISDDGKTFAMAASTSGNQGSGSTILIYRVGKGFIHFDTMTGIISGDWGMQGVIKSADRAKIHNVKISPSGDWLIVAEAGVTPGSIKGKHFWHIGTLDYSVVDGSTAGHFTEGYSHYINNGGTPFGNYESRLFTAPSSPVPLITQFPPGRLQPILDQHASWNNVDPLDTAPIFATTTSPKSVYPGPWYNEVIGIQNGKVIRFCHTYNLGTSKFFSGANAIGCVSQDAKYLVFCSDWMGSLGSGSLDNRIDVFIVELT